MDKIKFYEITVNHPHGLGNIKGQLLTTHYVSTTEKRLTQFMVKSFLEKELEYHDFKVDKADFKLGKITFWRIKIVDLDQ